MSFTDHLQQWLSGEIYQGRAMIALGLVVAAALLLVFRSQAPLLRGMIIPLCLLLVLLLGYGGAVAFGRQARVAEVTATYAESPAEVVAAEVAKHEKDARYCGLLMKVYPFLMIVGVLLLVLVSSPYIKGVGLGLVLLFCATYLVDSGFHSRSTRMLEALEQLR